MDNIPYNKAINDIQNAYVSQTKTYVYFKLSISMKKKIVIKIRMKYYQLSLWNICFYENGLTRDIHVQEVHSIT